MKSALFLISCFFTFTITFAQAKLTFKSKTLSVERKTEDDITKHIDLLVNDPGAKEDSVKVYIKSNSNSTDYSLDTVRLKIVHGVSALEFPFTIRKGKMTVKKDSVQLEAFSGGNAVSLWVYIVPAAEGFIETGAGINQYKISIGHSFDFFDNNNRLISYARFDAFNPTMISKKSGINFYVFQTNFNTSSSLNRLGDSTMVLDVLPLNPRQPQTGDSASFVRNFYTRTTKSTFKAFGFGLNSLLLISGNKTSAGTSIYLAPGFEYIRREVKLEYSFALTSSDTLKQPKSYPARYSTSAKQIQQVYHELYGGLGVIIDNENDIAHTRLKYTLGYLFTIGELTNSNLLNNKVGISQWFNIELMEKLTKLNLTLGVDWRQNRGTGFLYNVYLSKSFSLGKLKDLLFEE